MNQLQNKDAGGAVRTSARAASMLADVRTGMTPDPFSSAGDSSTSETQLSADIDIALNFADDVFTYVEIFKGPFLRTLAQFAKHLEKYRKQVLGEHQHRELQAKEVLERVLVDGLSGLDLLLPLLALSLGKEVGCCQGGRDGVRFYTRRPPCPMVPLPVRLLRLQPQVDRNVW